MIRVPLIIITQARVVSISACLHAHTHTHTLGTYIPEDGWKKFSIPFLCLLIVHNLPKASSTDHSTKVGTYLPTYLLSCTCVAAKPSSTGAVPRLSPDPTTGALAKIPSPVCDC